MQPSNSKKNIVRYLESVRTSGGSIFVSRNTKSWRLASANAYFHVVVHSHNMRTRQGGPKCWFPSNVHMYSTISLSPAKRFCLFGIGICGHFWKAQNLKRMTAKHDCKSNMHVPCISSFQPVYWSHTQLLLHAACCLFLYKCIYAHHYPPIWPNKLCLEILPALSHYAHVTCRFSGSVLGSNQFKNWWFHVLPKTHLEVLFLRVPLFNLDLPLWSMRGRHWHWCARPAWWVWKNQHLSFKQIRGHTSNIDSLESSCIMATDLFWPHVPWKPRKTTIQFETHFW